MNIEKDVLIAVTGSIAAFKACELVRNLTKSGISTKVIMTANATQFIGKVTFEALTGKRVLIDEYESGMPHIDSKNGISMLAVVPATANSIGKFANGIADDLVSSTYLAITVPVLIAPAMNPGMWSHPATQRNIKVLQLDGVHIISPLDGKVICGDEGYGKLAEISEIEKAIYKIIQKV